MTDFEPVPAPDLATLGEGSTIAILEHGFVVTGRITCLDVRDIAVVITSPFESPVSKGLHLGAYGFRYPPEYLYAFRGPDDRLVLTPCGLAKAQECLHVLCWIGCICRTHGIAIVADYLRLLRECHDGAIRAGAIDRKTFCERRRRLRIELRAGRMDERTYAKELRQQKQSNRQLEDAYYSALFQYEEILATRWGVGGYSRFLLEYAAGVVS